MGELEMKKSKMGRKGRKWNSREEKMQSDAKMTMNGRREIETRKRRKTKLITLNLFTARDWWLKIVSSIHLANGVPNEESIPSEYCNRPKYDHPLIAYQQR